MQQSPWVSIWVSPRATVARIVAENPGRSLWLLAAIYGFSSLLNLFQSASLGASFGPLTLVVIAVVLSPFWGYITFSVWSWVVFGVGRWFKGEGTYPAIRAAYAWSCVPFILNIPLWLVMIALFGRQLFLNFPEGYLLSDGMIAILFFILISKVILAIWSLVIYLNGLAEVQQYSILRAILNVIISGIIVSLVLGILWYLFLSFLGTTPAEPPKTTIQGSTLQLLLRGGL